MLELVEIVKDYVAKENTVHVLKGVSLKFRKSEFVAVLGPSGCGKTTLLNIIGGLDRYTSGDILVDGVSTKDYTDHDWDVYRNHRIGFVFQSYNLIPHLTVQRNVEMSLAIAGLPAETRKEKALAALSKVGLADQAKKKPAQLSGGQMQRVAIARALVNDPDIILADEPTGALDSESGVQVMELLSEIARDKLVIMVTHNNLLAEQYSTRIIDLRDGVVTSDSAPLVESDDGADETSESAAPTDDNASCGAVATAETGAETGDGESLSEAENAAGNVAAATTVAPEDKKAAKAGKAAKSGKKKSARSKKGSSEWSAAMSLGTAASLSFTNLVSKKGRTMLTALAGSIGIIGIILVLALSGGAQAYIVGMEEDVLSQYPIEINRTNSDLESVIEILMSENEEREEWPDDDEVCT